MGMKDTVFGTPKSTPKKRVSKKTTPRRSPRLNNVDKSTEGVSRKLSFVDLQQQPEDLPISKHSHASRSGCSQSKPVQDIDLDDDVFDVGHWVNATNKVKFFEDLENIQLENINIDECHLIEDPDTPPLYDSDDDIEYG
ncbi:hypothetical protein MKX03_010448, partial [Papaver bracteatum]